MFKNFKPRLTKWLYTSIQTTTSTTKVYKASRERHHDIYWFGMGGLYHPYVQLRIHDTILFTSIILSVDYKPLQFTPPIFTNIDAHKEGVTPQRYSAPRKPPKRISRFDFTTWSQRPQPKLPPGSIKPQLDPQ